MGYQVIASERITWPSAKAAAEARGGYLATIADGNENAFVFALVNAADYWAPGGSPASSFGPWLGGYREAGIWRWVTGEAWTFDNWYPGQPDMAGNVEDKLQFWSGMSNDRQATWNDLIAAGEILTDRPSAYVIEWNALP